MGADRKYPESRRHSIQSAISRRRRWRNRAVVDKGSLPADERLRVDRLARLRAASRGMSGKSDKDRYLEALARLVV